MMPRKVRVPGAAPATDHDERRTPKRSSSSVGKRQPRYTLVDTDLPRYTVVDTDLPPVYVPPHTTPSTDTTHATPTTHDTATTDSTAKPKGRPRRARSSHSFSEMSLTPEQEQLCLTESNTSHGVLRDTQGEGEDGELEEDALTCSICLDLLHRPRSLPCGHTFCLVCLQNYVNSCRSKFTCPWCRRGIHLPPEGVLGLPTNTALARGSQALRQQRQGGTNDLTCVSCGGGTGTGTGTGGGKCGHCGEWWCDVCGAVHGRMVVEAVTRLRERLLAARESLSCRGEDDETRFGRLEANIDEAVQERVALVQAQGRSLVSQVQEMRLNSQQQLVGLQKDIEKVLEKCPDGEEQWQTAGQHHATLTRLIQAASIAKVPRVTLDVSSLTLSTATSPSHAPDEGEPKDEVVEEEEVTSRDHSLMYRKKSSMARVRWGQNTVERPAGVAINPNTSEIYVTASDSCRLFVFDSSGRQVSTFGSRGHLDGQFLCPISVAFSQVSNEVFISDKWKHCIHVFDGEGNFIRLLGRKGKGYGHFTSPEGIATDRHGRIYVADTCNHRVQILDSDGIFLREIGVVSSETLRDGHRYTKSEFNEPSGVAASVDGSRVYVADTGNHRIKVFDGTTGQRVLMFGSRGQHKGQFESPECIAVDSEGFILVGDSDNGRVQVFRPNGNFVRYLGARGNKRGEFSWVSGVAVSKNHDVVVTDFKNNIVAVF